MLPFISTFNPNNPPAYNSVEVLKRNDVPGFESIKLLSSKHKRPNIKKIMTKAEFSNKEVGVKMC